MKFKFKVTNTQMCAILRIYGLLRNIWNPVKEPKKQETLDKYSLSLDEYVKAVMKMEYKQDLLMGVVDWCDDPDSFWEPSKAYGRDCDDFSMAYIQWARHNGYTAHEYIVVNNEKQDLIEALKTSHYVCVLEKDNNFILMNYYKYGPYVSETDAMNDMSRFNSYKTNLIYAKARDIKPIVG